MIEIAILKQSGRVAKVAFYYQLPAALQGFWLNTTPANTELDNDTKQMLVDGTVVEYVTKVRLNDVTLNKIKEQLSQLYAQPNTKTAAFRLVESRANLQRKDSIWS